MSDKTIFHVDKRDVKGKKVKTLRKQHIIPANIHGSIKEPIAVQVPQTEFIKLYEEVGDTAVIYLTINGDKTQHPALIDNIDYDPITDKIQHVTFKEVNLKEKITADVSIEFVGENEVPEAVVVETATTVPVEALPTDLPESFTVDISKLTEIGQSITFADLEFDKETVTLMIDEEQINEPIVILQAQAAEEPAETEVPAEAEEAEAEAGDKPGEADKQAEGGEEEKKAE